jgi:hypothetical protein
MIVAGWAISISRTILDTVGVQYVLADLNRRSLAHDITGAWNFYRNYQAEASKGWRTAI